MSHTFGQNKDGGSRPPSLFCPKVWDIAAGLLIGWTRNRR
jgi:hypothetical protein